MKKILKWSGIVFCSMGLIAYTSMIFTEDPSLRPVFIFMDFLMGFFLFLLIRKKKVKKEKIMTQPKRQINTSLNQDRAIHAMKGSYTPTQAKDHIRILQDCLNLIEKTKNLETFFSRSEYGMQIALTLDQAQKAGIVSGTSDFPILFYKAVNSQKARVLLESFWAEKEKIDKFATAKTKITHWRRYLELLEKYSDQYEFEFQDEFQEVQAKVSTEISKIESVTPYR